ncbi:hypothetical protein [Burkholderia cepacia]|uniref:hypothetical protein n=1 Tax=Burkholderia cepacia TaxID=292 RepID=UPI0012D995DD|nr:hypothetical protein [Burkholderia cepacia]
MSLPVTSVLQFAALLAVHADARWASPVTRLISIVVGAILSSTGVLIVLHVVAERRRRKNLFRGCTGELHTETGRIIGLLIGLLIGLPVGMLAFEWVIGM